jgi:hypothetical protein
MISKSSLLLSFRKEESSFLKKRSKRLLISERCPAYGGKMNGLPELGKGGGTLYAVADAALPSSACMRLDPDRIRIRFGTEACR